MDAMKQYLVPDERIFIPLMVFLGALTLTDVVTAISILLAFLTIIFIPGNMVTYFLFPDSKDRIILALPAGFGLLPMMAYLAGAFGIPLVNPIVPVLFSLLSLGLMYYRDEVLIKVKDLTMKSSQ